MIFRLIIVCILILEFFGCSSISPTIKVETHQSCYESEYMEDNSECIENELISLEQELNDNQRSIYEMAKRKLSDKYQQLYFLRLSPSERISYLSYIYEGDPPIFVRKSFF